MDTRDVPEGETRWFCPACLIRQVSFIFHPLRSLSQERIIYFKILESAA